MDTKSSHNRKFKRMFVNILVFFIIAALTFPVMGTASAQETALPEGWHDGVDGTVRAADCGAFGWAVDPDDRDRDLQVQILADGVPVATITANLLREDVDACTGGTCGFGVNLWGLISAGEQHLITAQAYDEETETWVDLSGTPKALTCWGYPEGFHDGMEGTVDANSCTAFGWAADPDNRDRDVLVQILSDGSPVASVNASNYGDDMDRLGICPEGTCRFTVNLWGLITPDEEHQILAQAYDVESDAWLNLEATPKSLTCQTPPPPSPWVRAHPEWESIDGWYWPFGATLHLTIDDPNTPTSPDLEMSKTVDVVSGPPDNNSVWFEFAGTYDLKPGDVVTMTDGTTTRNLIVSNVAITAVDVINDTVAGIAEPGTTVRLPIPGELLATADGEGNWYADFAAIGLDLVPGMVIAEVYDEDGDLTSFERDAYALGWQQINVSGFGDPSTTGVTSLEVFRGQLYAGASNWNSGGQVWRLSENGQWLQVSDPGFGSGPSIPAAVDLEAFKGQLYAGVGWGDAPGQVWRTRDGTNWEPVTTDGFGDGANGVVSNFAAFQGMLYAGTGNATGSAQIWRSKTGDSGTWTRVAPDEADFTGNVTGFAVYNDVLFTAIESSFGAPVQVWRSTNGRDWTIVTADGFGDANNISAGGVAEFGGYLYLGIRNDVTGGQIWRTADGMNWEPVVNNGFGDINNLKIESLIVYNDTLYAATYNPTGLQFWLSADGVNWEQISANGFGDSNNFSTLWNNAIATYRGHLLIGTWNNAEGGELWMFTP